MSKSEIKELSFMIVFCIINSIIAFVITAALGITNTIIIKSFSTIYGDITWEVVIFMILLLIEGIIYDGFFSDNPFFYKLQTY